MHVYTVLKVAGEPVNMTFFPLLLICISIDIVQLHAALVCGT